MIMGFPLSYGGAAFFIGIVMVLVVKSDSLEATSASVETVAGPSLQFSSNVPQQISEKCAPLKGKLFIREEIDILSPKIFSQTDLIRYLVDETIKIPYRSADWVREILNNHLQAGELPHCYVPYAKALSSLLRCWPDIDNVKYYIGYVKKLLSNKALDFSFLPSDMSLSPEILQLFSDEILWDPTPPQRIFYKLMNMPKNDILNLEDQLQKFVERTNFIRYGLSLNKYFIWYAYAVWKFLENESAFDDLKRDMSEIQRLANSGQHFSRATLTA